MSNYFIFDEKFYYIYCDFIQPQFVYWNEKFTPELHCKVSRPAWSLLVSVTH